MTAARRQRKGYRIPGAALGTLALALFAGLPLTGAAATERIVVDRHTGLAIGGYDPVAFFTDGRPRLGKPEFELRHGGAVWRFRNVGNREAFAERPEVYTPQFGGYDPVGVARGAAVAGSPDLWLISGERLFLFYDHARLEKFSADPERVIATAERKWPDAARTLSP
jgi:hypothetical protein